MNKTINELTEITSLAKDDEFIVFEDVSGQTKKSKMQKIFDIVHPVGEVYVQYPFTESPNNLYAGFGTWEEIDYNGSFFRATGGNAAAFETKQAEELPNITGKIRATDYSIGNNQNSATTSTGALKATDFDKKTCGGTSSYAQYQSGIEFNAHDSNPIYKDGGHVTPENYSIRIWKRTL